MIIEKKNANKLNESRPFDAIPIRFITKRSTDIVRYTVTTDVQVRFNRRFADLCGYCSLFFLLQTPECA